MATYYGPWQNGLRNFIDIDNRVEDGSGVIFLVSAGVQSSGYTGAYKFFDCTLEYYIDGRLQEAVHSSVYVKSDGYHYSFYNIEIPVEKAHEEINFQILHDNRFITSFSSSAKYDDYIDPRTRHSVKYYDGLTLFREEQAWHGEDYYITSAVPSAHGWTYIGWKAEGYSIIVRPGTRYDVSKDISFYAVREVDENWPSCTYGELTDETMQSWTVGYSVPSIVISDLYSYSGSATATLKVGNQTVSRTTDGKLTMPSAINASGEVSVSVIVQDQEDTEKTIVYSLGTINVERPRYKVLTWDGTQGLRIAKSDYPIPEITNGQSKVTVSAKKNNSSAYDIIGYTWTVRNIDADYWTIEGIVLDEGYISNDEAILKIAYTVMVSDSPQIVSFYHSTRNALYSNGISNNVFISGSTSANYSSRVWWSYINNPTYFPDTNYIEVGSNDTQVMGLCKVGDYLGAVKQSKTTDTAIFLLYPTSFDDDTTFAVKQGVQGIGALGKYSFNVLGGETLFLSPNGVMAIVPSEDEEHKVQNRSYFVDGKLLKEENLKDSYSFVYDGMYWLCVGTHCYVLDGNQKNSYGNDKTNLVYEAYYLENIPASCFMKYKDRLWFSNEDCLCRFKDEDDVGTYVDGYMAEPVMYVSLNVAARWSTLLDDDGALHYYKTMQKKGNVVSILPVEGNPYTNVDITEEEFNADKTRYYVLIAGDYVHCTEVFTYDENAEYYIKLPTTSAQVYIKKDAEHPIFVGTVNGDVEDTGDIPNELHIRKKIKKYKRLQFIVSNAYDEPFGVDQITKSFFIGNYAKR